MGSMQCLTYEMCLTFEMCDKKYKAGGRGLHLASDLLSGFIFETGVPGAIQARMPSLVHVHHDIRVVWNWKCP